MKNKFLLTVLLVVLFLNLNAQNFSNRNYIFNSNTLNNRADQSSAIILDNGDLVVGFSLFGNSWLDTASSAIFLSTSKDGGYNWDEGYMLIPPISLGSYIPSFYRKSNGNILCVFFVRETSSPFYSSTIRQIEFDGNLKNVVTPIKTIYTGGYNPIGADRLFYDSEHDLLLFPFPILISGTGHSTVSVYNGGLLVSKDEGNTWVDSGLILEGKLDLKGFGGCMEPGVFKNLDNLGYYCRTTLGNIQYSQLNYIGESPPFYSASSFKSVGQNAQNAQSTIKYIESMNLFVASYTNVNTSNPLNFDRQKMSVSASTDGLNWSKVFILDSVENSGYQINSVNIFEDKVRNNLIFFYSIAPFSGFFDLLCKVVSLPENFKNNNRILSVEQIESKGINVYPNPSSNFIYTSGVIDKEEYEIFDSFGKGVLKGSISNGEKIEIKNVSSGIYFLKFNNGITVKFIKL